MTPTILIIFFALLPYTDFFLNFFVNTSKIKIGNAFNNLGAQIWSYSMCISPLLIYRLAKYKHHWLAEIIINYIYISMFLGFFLLDVKLNIESDTVFRLVALGLSVLLLIIGKYLLRYFRLLVLEDEVDTELKKMEKQQND